MGVEEQDEPGGLDKGTTDGRTGAGSQVGLTLDVS